MRGDGGNHHDKLGLKRISSSSQLTVPDTAGTNADLACNNTDTRSSPPNLASCTTNFSYISINSCFRQKHPGVPDGSDSCDRTLYTLTEKYALPVTLHTYLS